MTQYPIAMVGVPPTRVEFPLAGEAPRLPARGIAATGSLRWADARRWRL